MISYLIIKQIKSNSCVCRHCWGGGCKLPLFYMGKCLDQKEKRGEKYCGGITWTFYKTLHVLFYLLYIYNSFFNLLFIYNASLSKCRISIKGRNSFPSLSHSNVKYNYLTASLIEWTLVLQIYTAQLFSNIKYFYYLYFYIQKNNCIADLLS